MLSAFLNKHEVSYIDEKTRSLSKDKNGVKPVNGIN